MARAISMHTKDNVATVFMDIRVGEKIDIEGGGSSPRIEAAEVVPFGHKISLSPIAARKRILK